MIHIEPPLHIDFIPRIRRFETERGYWFMTWIFGPNRIQVLCKLYNGWWRVETPKKYEMFIVPHPGENMNGPNFLKFGEYKDALDKILEQYMIDNNYTEPYHYYWLKTNDGRMEM